MSIFSPNVDDTIASAVAAPVLSRNPLVAIPVVYRGSKRCAILVLARVDNGLTVRMTVRPLPLFKGAPIRNARAQLLLYCCVPRKASVVMTDTNADVLREEFISVRRMLGQ